MAQLQVFLCIAVVLATTWVEGGVTKNVVSLKKRDIAPPHIPKNCKNIGFCLDVPNYPTSDIEDLLKGLENSYVFQNDSLEKKPVDRISYDYDPNNTKNLCNSTEKILKLKVAKDEDNEWLWVVNLPNQSQGFRAEICNFLVSTEISPTKKSTSSSKCEGFIVSIGDYSDAVCQQSYGYRTALVINRQEQLQYNQILVPTCCSCVPQGLKLP